MNNWDLWIVYPILFVFSIFFIGFSLKKEKSSKQSLIFYLEILLFWISMGFINNLSFNQLGESVSVISKSTFIFLIIFSSILLAIFLKPIATLVTGIIKNRRIWIWASYLSSIISLILLTVLILNSFNIFLFILLVLFSSISLTTNTLHYLFLNEQFYYRINPIAIVWIVSSIMALATFISNYIFDINVLFDSNIAYLIIPSFVFVFMAIVLSLFKKENKNFSGGFTEVIRKEFSQKDVPIFIVMCVIAFLTSISNSLTNSEVYKIYMSLLMVKENYNNEQISLVLRFFEYLNLIPAIIFGYILFKYVFQFINFKLMLISNLFLLSLIYTIYAFSHSHYVILIGAFVTSVCFSQITFSIFSISMFWNYRISKLPITGYVSSSTLAGSYLISTITDVLSFNKNGIFDKINSTNYIINNREQLVGEQLQDQIYYFSEIVSLFAAVAFLLIMVCVLLVYFFNKRMLVEFADYKLAMTNLKFVLKRGISEKAKTQIDLEELEDV